MPVKYPRPAAGAVAEQTDTYVKKEKHQVELTKNLRKPSVTKAKEPVTDWFILQAGDDPGPGDGTEWVWRNDFKSIHRGTRKECLDYIVTYKRKNPKDTTEMFLAHGLKVI